MSNLIKSNLQWRILDEPDVSREGLLETIWSVYEYESTHGHILIPSLEQLVNDESVEDEFRGISSLIKFGDWDYYENVIELEKDEQEKQELLEEYWDKLDSCVDAFDQDCVQLINQYRLCYEHKGRFIHVPWTQVW